MIDIRNLFLTHNLDKISFEMIKDDEKTLLKLTVYKKGIGEIDSIREQGSLLNRDIQRLCYHMGYKIKEKQIENNNLSTNHV